MALFLLFIVFLVGGIPSGVWNNAASSVSTEMAQKGRFYFLGIVDR